MLNEITVTNTKIYLSISTKKEGTLEVVLDAQDLEAVNSIEGRWGLFTASNGKKSVRAGKSDGQVFLHKLIYDLQPGERLEFINGDQLDFRRENVNKVTKAGDVIPMYVPKKEPKKVATKAPLREKAVSAAKESKPQSDVPGVKYHKASGRWTARIYWEGVRHSLGYFKEMKDAEREAAIFRAEGPDSPNLKRNQKKGA